jgi:hypothetical protein
MLTGLPFRDLPFRETPVRDGQARRPFAYWMLIAAAMKPYLTIALAKSAGGIDNGGTLTRRSGSPTPCAGSDSVARAAFGTVRLSNPIPSPPWLLDQRREKIGVDRHHPLYGVWRDLPVG